jgi:hypothetical protein
MSAQAEQSERSAHFAGQSSTYSTDDSSTQILVVPDAYHGVGVAIGGW